MNNRNIHSRSQAVINRVRLIGIIVVCLVLASTAPAVVRAAIAAINTNDGAWDSNWGTPMRIDGDDAGIEDDVDIDTFWVNTNAASPTMYYFGVSTVTALRAGGGTRICVKVDCNNNGFVTDAADRVLELNPGDTYYDVAGNNSDTWEAVPNTDGEFVNTRYVEARTNNSGSLSWAGCMASNPLMQAEVRDGFCPDQGTAYDATELRRYDLPTAIQLNQASARSSNEGPLNLALVLGLLTAGGLMLIVVNRRAKQRG